MNNYRPNIILVLLVALLLFIGSCVQGWCEENEDVRTLEMYSGEPYSAVSAARNPQPVSQIAENVTVVTADEIKALNAHTVADVLNTVPGVQIESRRTPGSFAYLQLQGARFSHILVLLDGIPINSPADSFADIGALPVQNVERIEIVKGPGSSAWGQALGGVINIITKSPSDRKLGGTVSASLGEAFTGDYRGELTGTTGRTGYYLFASNLRSDGLLPNNSVDERNAYAKFRRELPRQGSLLFTFDYNGGERGDFVSPLDDLSSHIDTQYLQSSLTLTQHLTERLDLELAARGSWRDSRTFGDQFSTGMELIRVSGTETTVGASGKLSWRQGVHSLAVGTDYDHGGLKADNTITPTATKNRRIDKVGVFANDTISIGRFAVTPGVRYDQSNTNGDFLSPSLGVTWSLTDHTILRGFAGRGFSLPALLNDHATEKVLSFQVGVESTELKYFWLKGTFFRNDTWDVTSYSVTGVTTLHDQLKQGVEVEIKTVPVFHTSLLAGYVFTDATDKTTGAQLPDIARHTVDLGLEYHDDRWLHGKLVGRYIDWTKDPREFGKSRAMIWDLHLAKKIVTSDNSAVELFFSAHNLFNGAQYQFYIFENPRRWFEGGVRFGF